MFWFNNLFNIYIDKKNKSVSKLAKFRNDFTFQLKFMDFVNDALHRYKITGLPETVSERVVLESLLWYGSVVFFEKYNNLLALPGLPDGSGINVYGDFAGAYVYGATGYNERINLVLPGSDNNKLLATTVSGQKITEGSGVLVRENPLMYPFMNTVLYFTECVSDSLRTLDVSRENIKRPYIITAEDMVIPTVKRYFNNVKNNENYIISSGVFPADKISILPFEYNSDYLKAATSLVDWYDQRFREACGIRNMGGQIDKKGENLISAEVTQNDDYTKHRSDLVLTSINRGLDIVNQYFGVNIQAKEYEYEDIQRNEGGWSSYLSDSSSGGSSTNNI